MKTKTVFLGLCCVCFLAAAANALSIENLISLLRPDFFRLDGWLAYSMTITTSITTTTTTTMPSFTFGNESVQYNISWCLNITQLSVNDYAFLYQGHKIDLNQSDVQVIQQVDLLSDNCTRVIRARTDTDFIPVCNLILRPDDIPGKTCKYAPSECIATQDSCGGNSGQWNCEYSY